MGCAFKQALEVIDWPAGKVMHGVQQSVRIRSWVSQQREPPHLIGEAGRGIRLEHQILYQHIARCSSEREAEPFQRSCRIRQTIAMYPAATWKLYAVIDDEEVGHCEQPKIASIRHEVRLH